MSDAGKITGKIELENCEKDCPCQRVHIVHRDLDGEVEFACSLDPQLAREFAKDILHRADIAEAQQAKNDGRLS